jgi:hypothetical protein
MKAPSVTSCIADLQATLEQIESLGAIHRDNHPRYKALVEQAIHLATQIPKIVNEFIQANHQANLETHKQVILTRHKKRR